MLRGKKYIKRGCCAHRSNVLELSLLSILFWINKKIKLVELLLFLMIAL